jgi:hypothetical protein
MEQLLLLCGALSSPTLCRFIPALSARPHPELVLSQYYTDGRGDILNRGAKVVYSKALPRIASSTAVKTRPDFGKLVQEVRQEVFEPKHKKHVTGFNLSHPDDFQTLSDEESKK